MIIYFKSILDVWQIVVWKFYVYDRSHDLYYLTIFKHQTSFTIIY